MPRDVTDPLAEFGFDPESELQPSALVASLQRILAPMEAALQQPDPRLAALRSVTTLREACDRLKRLIVALEALDEARAERREPTLQFDAPHSQPARLVIAGDQGEPPRD